MAEIGKLICRVSSDQPGIWRNHRPKKLPVAWRTFGRRIWSSEVARRVLSSSDGRRTLRGRARHLGRPRRSPPSDGA